MYLYENTAFPIMTNNDETMITTELAKYIAIGENEYIEFTSLEHCEEEEQTYFCTINHQIHSKTQKSCTLSLVMNDTTNCAFDRIELKDVRYTVNIEGTWFLFLMDKIQGTLSCPGREDNLLQNYQGIIAITPPCTLRTAHFSLPTLHLGKAVPQNHTAEIIKFNKIILKPQHKSNISSITKELKELSDETKSKFKEIDEITVHTSNNHAITTNLTSFNIIALIAVIVTMIILIGMGRYKLATLKELVLNNSNRDRNYIFSPQTKARNTRNKNRREMSFHLYEEMKLNRLPSTYAPRGNPIETTVDTHQKAVNVQEEKVSKEKSTEKKETTVAKTKAVTKTEHTTQPVTTTTTTTTTPAVVTTTTTAPNKQDEPPVKRARPNTLNIPAFSKCKDYKSHN